MSEKAPAEDVYPVTKMLVSPDGAYTAQADTYRTCAEITVRENESGRKWRFALPDGSPIPEYTFLAEDWCEWMDENTLRLSVGRGGDAGAERLYRVAVVPHGEKLEGYVLEEVLWLPEISFDLDHDGQADDISVAALCDADEDGSLHPAWYELHIGDCWRQEASLAHLGWAGIFALELEGQDYLLRYDPYMGQGVGTFRYQIFSLNEKGEELILRENAVEFDINFGAPHHMGFDPQAVAAFLEEVHGCLDQSCLLLSTHGGELRMDGDGGDFVEDCFADADLYDGGSIEENLREWAKRYQPPGGAS